MTDNILDIQRLGAGSQIVNKFGYNFAVGTAEPQTVWDGGLVNTGKYGYGLRETPNTLDITSSDISDTMTINIEGLSEDLSLQTERITLNGTTIVQSTKIFSRIFRAYNSSDTDLVGDISGYVTGSLLQEDKLFFIEAQYQQTLMALYTIPKGKTGYVFEFIRRPGGVFRLGDLIVSYESSFDKHVPYQRIEAGTDIEVRAQADADNTNISARFKMILMDNTYSAVSK